MRLLSSIPAGDKNTFVVVVSCLPNGSETGAKLTRGTVGQTPARDRTDCGEIREQPTLRRGMV